MKRAEANRLILAELARLADEHPDWRFHQLLQNSGAASPGRDQFYEESETTLAKIRSEGGLGLSPAGKRPEAG